MTLQFRLLFKKEGYMHKLTRHAISVLMISALLLVPFGSTVLAGQGSYGSPLGPGTGEERSSGEMLFDLFAVRPVGILATATGTAAYFLSLPFTILGGNSEEAGQKLVKEPALHAFKRPLGQ
jgi:hypothetical protein